MLSKLTWRSRANIPMQPQMKTSTELISDIAEALKRQVDDGKITNLQLSQIVELAANTERLQTALTWLA